MQNDSGHVLKKVAGRPNCQKIKNVAHAHFFRIFVHPRPRGEIGALREKSHKSQFTHCLRVWDLAFVLFYLFAANPLNPQANTGSGIVFHKCVGDLIFYEY